MNLDLYCLMHLFFVMFDKIRCKYRFVAIKTYYSSCLPKTAFAFANYVTLRVTLQKNIGEIKMNKFDRISLFNRLIYDTYV